ncbi:hypothetical protein [Promicromonospora sp. NPDC023987]|uniref:hypothetical protein n=1 Tax=Promicromonospora sp. NPDC023987 TaxID=3155360 RepID=UPI0033EDEBD1
MSTAREHLDAVFANLSDALQLSPLTENPVIQSGKHAVMYHLVNSVPVENLGKNRLRDTTWVVAIISPLTNWDTAVNGLEEALDDVLDVLEQEPTLRWTTAAFEPFNARLWCYSVEVTLYNEVENDIQPAEPLVELSSMTVKALRAHASDNNIALGGARLKADIISVLES